MTTTEGPDTPVVEQQQIVSFSVDREPDYKTFSNHREINMNLLRNVEESIDHDVKSFLSRPVVVANGTFSTADARGAVKNTIDVPDVITTNTMFQEKLNGFLAFRATANLRIQLNAEQFQQGRLLLVYFPQAALNIGRYNCAVMSQVLQTQLPRGELDCIADSVLELSMPYVSPTSHYDLINNRGNNGRFQLSVYSPLVSPTGSTTASYTIWLYFTDVHIEFPAKRAFIGLGFQMAQPQMAKKPKGSTGEQEAAAAGKGPVSFALGKVAQVANVFTDVPVLSEIASTVSWIANIGASIASIFGWSKAADSSPSQKVTQVPLPYHQNINAISTVQKLALTSDNEVTIVPGFAGTDNDEMTIAHIAQRPAYIANYSWTDAVAADAQIATGNVSPSSFLKTRSVATNTTPLTIVDSIPASYIANFFRYWRGSWVFTFKFIKTKFHSGRVGFAYSPGDGVGAPSNTDRYYLYREIFDLRDSNEFTVTIPYTDIVAYKLFSENIGSWQLYCVSPLVHPSTVDSQVDILLEVSAGSDFEVSVPQTALTYVPIYVVPAGGSFVPESDSEEEIIVDKPIRIKKVKPQMAVGVNVVSNSPIETQNIEDPISMTSISSGGIATAAACIGERILSLRQMLRCYTLVGRVSSTTNFLINPRSIDMNKLVASSAPSYIPAGITADYFSSFVPLFGYQRGSVRVSGYCIENISAELYRVSNADSVNDDTFLAASSVNVDMNRPTVSYNPAVSFEVESPFYSRVYSLMNYIRGTATVPYILYRSTQRIMVYSASSVSTNVQRSVGEDFNCGFFLGVMPLIVADGTTDPKGTV